MVGMRQNFSGFGALFLPTQLIIKLFTMKKIAFFAVALFMASAAIAQQNPVKWSYEAKKVADAPKGELLYDLVFTAHISDGWYVYSQYLESDDGPIRTSFTYDEANTLVKMDGKNVEDGHKYEGYDDLFGMNIIKFKGNTTFTQRVKISAPTTLKGSVEFMTCDHERCLPPSDVPFRFDLK
jgi:Disulphide bond corrector protein DsbC